MPDLVIYHGGCWDGFCAAWIAHEAYPAAEYIPFQYGQDPPDVAGKDVWILDFSFKRAILQGMAQVAKSILVLDHHKSAREDLSQINTVAWDDGGGVKSETKKIQCVFDMEKSGGRLTWEYMHGNRPAPWLVDYTEDRDLWRWKLPCSREINASLRTLPLDFTAWDLLAANPTATDTMRLEGAGILRREKQLVDQHVEHAVEVTLCGLTGLCVNATALFSEIAGELAKGRPFGAAWFESDKERVWSLRSEDGGADVSAIAMAHGGGGHKHAAGFAVPVTGALGTYSDHQKSDDDEGDIRVAIAADPGAGLVRLDFGKKVSWLALPKQQAVAWANMIRSKADQLK